MENYFYAQIDEQNICIATSSLSGEVINDFMIRLDNMDSTLLGMEYIKSTNSWETVITPPLPLKPYEPTQIDSIQANVEYLMAISL